MRMPSYSESPGMKKCGRGPHSIERSHRAAASWLINTPLRRLLDLAFHGQYRRTMARKTSARVRFRNRPESDQATGWMRYRGAPAFASDAVVQIAAAAAILPSTRRYAFLTSTVSNS